MRRGSIAAALLLVSGSTSEARDRWAGGWGYPTAPASGKPQDVLPAGTYRYRIRLSQAGDAVRLTLANPDKAPPLIVTRLTVAPALAAEGFAIDPRRERLVRAAAATLPAGGEAIGAPVRLRVDTAHDVIVTLVTGGPSAAVGGNAGFPAAFAADGTTFEARKLRPLVSLIAVRNPPVTCTVVAFGDSITEGARGTRPDRRGWPGELARRLAQASPARHCGVVNAGISGNRLLREDRGTAGIARFDRDVAAVPGASDLIVLEGINDIWRSTLPGEPPLAAADLIAGYRTLIAKGHARGMRVIGATLTPGAGSKYLTPPLEAIRQEVNRWIRTGGAFDAVVDLEAAVRDDAQPPHLRPEDDSGDHLHPGDAGYAAMGAAVPLTLFPPR